ncbi:hypothetical protein ABZ851_16605 [Streptomyces sp. NPDC047049]|uniref:hypothetical protein n=1 Tax=Streptomyces sp. NPDC047049 TaxID=3156688 RepID=UPI0034006C7F
MDCADFLMLDESSRTSSSTLAVLGQRALRLPLSGWLLRLARGSEGRPALEVHSAAGLIDVSVVSTLCVSPVRGARRGGGPAAPWSLAWGQLPPGADVVGVSFRGWRSSRCVQAVTLADAYWVAEVDGRFRSVTCSAGASRVTTRVAREARRREG